MIRHTPIHFALALWSRFSSALDSLRPLASLVARAYLAQAFFLSGLTKIRDWEITLLLFTEEYQVPFLSPQVAAVMGTAGELVTRIDTSSSQLAGRLDETVKFWEGWAAACTYKGAYQGDVLRSVVVL